MKHRTASTDLPHIEATLNYLAPMAERPRNYTFDPPPGVARSNSHARGAHRGDPRCASGRVGHLARPRRSSRY